jgi:hypothetical protein
MVELLLLCHQEVEAGRSEEIFTSATCSLLSEGALSCSFFFGCFSSVCNGCFRLSVLEQESYYRVVSLSISACHQFDALTVICPCSSEGQCG